VRERERDKRKSGKYLICGGCEIEKVKIWITNR